MGREKRDVGMLGEKIASHFLRKKGYKISDINARTPFGEIDIISQKNKVTIFVEVRTRATSSFGPPSYSITYRKRRHLILNALWYMSKNKLHGSDCRIDFIGIMLDSCNNIKEIEHIENAVEGL